jgi:hypothetical protein
MERPVELWREETRTAFRKLIEETLSAEVSEATYKRLTTIQKTQRWDDAISIQHPASLNEIPKRQRNNNKFHQVVSANLAHLVINPTKRPEASEALVSAYVFDDTHPDSLNRSGEAIQEFVEALVRDAHANREAAEGDLHDVSPIDRFRMRKTVRLVVGRRGVGKTFFLNHLLAKYSTYFDKEKVIWVRLNLVDNFGTNKDMLHWIYAQATKIVLRYYCKDSPFGIKEAPGCSLDSVEALRSYYQAQRNFDVQAGERALGQIQNLKDVFVDCKTDEAITPDSIPKPLARHVWAHAVANGFAFIVAIDGLDRLESSISAGAKFETLVSALGELLAASETLPCALVVASRRKTADELMQVQTGPFNSHPPIRALITVPPFERVLAKRLDFLETFLRREEVGKVTEVKGDLVAALLSDFRRSVEPEVAEFKMFGQNLRASMQALQLRHKEFTTYGSDNHHYRWIESVMRMGWKFPPKLSEYFPGHSVENPFDFNPTDQIAYDNRLLPSVFSYPYIPWTFSSTIKPNFANVMLGVRILQIIRASDQLISELKAESRVTIEIVTDLLEVLFPEYSGSICLAMIRDLIEFDVIDADNMSMSISNQPGKRSVVRLTPKGVYTLDHCMTDVAYLGMSAMRIPMDAAVLITDSEGVPPLFLACSHVGDVRLEMSQRGLIDWIRAKTINSINLVKLLEYLDRQQMRAISFRRADIERRLANKRRDHGLQTWRTRIIEAFLMNKPAIFSAPRSHLLGQIVGMIDSILSEDRKTLVDGFLASLDHNRQIWKG